MQHKSESEITQLIDLELETIASKNAEIFTEQWLSKILTHADTQKFPEVKEVTDNIFGQFVATSFKSAEQMAEVINTRFQEFLNNPGSTEDETTFQYVKAMAFCQYSLFIAKAVYENAIRQLEANIETLAKSVTKKEDPNVELN